MIIKSKKDIEALRVGGKRLSKVMDELEKVLRPGITTKELDTLAEKLIRDGGDTPAFLEYQPTGADYPFPATLCISVNDEIVHGIPGSRVLKAGDIVSLDLGLIHEGLVVDMARTLPVGEVTDEAMELLNNTRDALKAGIKAAKVGGHIGDIASAIEECGIRGGYGIVRELGGHGVGHKVHEPPFVPNYGAKGTGPRLQENMVLALEPMFNIGEDDIELDADGYTIRTKDGSLSAHFEHTIVLTKKGPEVVTVS